MDKKKWFNAQHYIEISLFYFLFIVSVSLETVRYLNAALMSVPNLLKAIMKQRLQLCGAYSVTVLCLMQHVMTTLVSIT